MTNASLSPCISLPNQKEKAQRSGGLEVAKKGKETHGLLSSSSSYAIDFQERGEKKGER